MPKIKRVAPFKKAITTMQASEATTAESNFGELAPTPRASPTYGGAQEEPKRMVVPQSSKAKQARMKQARRRARTGTMVLKEIRKYQRCTDLILPKYPF